MGTENPPITRNGLFDQELLDLMAELLNFTYSDLIKLLFWGVMVVYFITGTKFVHLKMSWR